MKLDISDYKTIVFDCDGVVLNSNKVKTSAFFQTALRYGEGAASALVDYHIENGGVSRYHKFTYFLENIVKDLSDASLQQLLQDYALNVRVGLLECDIAPRIKELRAFTAQSNWLIVSGGDQKELRDIFRIRGLSSLFDGGIYGSPDNKEYIMAREIDKGNIAGSALFIGDSKYDYAAAKAVGIDFLFVDKWTEVRDFQIWLKNNNIQSLHSIECLLRY